MTIKIHSIETLGALDGPGIRTVIFFQGCPMKCGYCHNADAIPSVGGEEKTVEELVEFCSRYKNYYGREGGVTLSGGEPLLQPQGAKKLLTAYHRIGINTVLDTSGAVFAPEVLELADLVILDMKHSGPEQFFILTGLPIDNTLKTLDFLQNNNRAFRIRQVIVPGFNDTEQQVMRLKSLCAGAEKIELLPLHHHGAHKWRILNEPYRYQDKAVPSKESMEKLRGLL